MEPNQKGDRRVIDLSAVAMPEIPVFGRYEYFEARPGLSEHSHPNMIEICYLERGHQTYRVEGREYRLVGGDIFVTAPGEPHDTGGYHEERGKLYWLNLKLPKGKRPFLLLSPADGKALTESLVNLPRRCFAGSGSIKSIFEEIFHLYDDQEHPFRQVGIANQLVRLLLTVIECGHESRKDHSTPMIERLIRCIEANPEAEYNLADLADQAALSLSRFKARFKHEKGITPHDFIQHCKIEAAKNLLARGGKTNTEIAMELNFSSSQYFATVFKRCTMQTPTEYRKIGCKIHLRPG